MRLDNSILCVSCLINISHFYGSNKPHPFLITGAKIDTHIHVSVVDFLEFSKKDSFSFRLIQFTILFVFRWSSCGSHILLDIYWEGSFPSWMSNNWFPMSTQDQLMRHWILSNLFKMKMSTWTIPSWGFIFQWRSLPRGVPFELLSKYSVASPDWITDGPDFSQTSLLRNEAS